MTNLTEAIELLSEVRDLLEKVHGDGTGNLGIAQAKVDLAFFRLNTHKKQTETRDYDTNRRKYLDLTTYTRTKRTAY